MLEPERIRSQICGCQYDRVTGLFVEICPSHEGVREATVGKARMERVQPEQEKRDE